MKPLTIVTLSLVTASSALAHVHFDIAALYPGTGDTISLGGISHASTENPFTGQTGLPSSRYYNPGQRVFEYEFGEDSAEPYLLGEPGAGDPGFGPDDAFFVDPSGNTQHLTGTGFANGTRLYVRALGDLQYWTGAGFSSVPSGEQLNWQGSSPSIVIGTGTGTPQTRIKTFTTSDDLHVHAAVSIESIADGSDLPTEGVYLLAAQFLARDASDNLFAQSAPFYVVALLGSDEASHEAAVDYVQSTLVPEPGSLALLASGGLLLRRRRR